MTNYVIKLKHNGKETVDWVCFPDSNRLSALKYAQEHFKKIHGFDIINSKLPITDLFKINKITIKNNETIAYCCIL